MVPEPRFPAAPSLPSLLAVVATLALSACSGAGNFLGATIGAGASKVASVVSGSPNADFLGPRISKALDAEAEVAAAAAQYRALETAQPGTPITWLHQHVYGTVTAGPYVTVRGHDRCREYSHTIYIKSRPEVTRAVACRQADGSWKRIGATS